MSVVAYRSGSPAALRGGWADGTGAAGAAGAAHCEAGEGYYESNFTLDGKPDVESRHGRPLTRRQNGYRARPTTASPFHDSIRSHRPCRHEAIAIRYFAAAWEELFENQYRKEGKFSSCDRFPSRAAPERAPLKTTLATDYPQPSSTNPTDFPNPISLTTATRMSAPSTQQESLKQTDESIRQLAEDREKNYREEQSVDAAIVLRILEQETETDG